MSRSYTSSPRCASMACSGTALLFYCATTAGYSPVSTGGVKDGQMIAENDTRRLIIAKLE
jgi:hypothetical protein